MNLREQHFFSGTSCLKVFGCACFHTHQQQQQQAPVLSTFTFLNIKKKKNGMQRYSLKLPTFALKAALLACLVRQHSVRPAARCFVMFTDRHQYIAGAGPYFGIHCLDDIKCSKLKKMLYGLCFETNHTLLRFVLSHGQVILQSPAGH